MADSSSSSSATTSGGEPPRDDRGKGVAVEMESLLPQPEHKPQRKPPRNAPIFYTEHHDPYGADEYNQPRPSLVEMSRFQAARGLLYSGTWPRDKTGRWGKTGRGRPSEEEIEPLFQPEGLELQQLNPPQHVVQIPPHNLPLHHPPPPPLGAQLRASITAGFARLRASITAGFARLRASMTASSAQLQASVTACSAQIQASITACFASVGPLLTAFFTSAWAYLRKRKCWWLLVFVVYYIVGLAIYIGCQLTSMSHAEGLSFYGSSVGSNSTVCTNSTIGSNSTGCRNSTLVDMFIDANYFNVATLSTIGFGDVYPSDTRAQVWISLYILFGLPIVTIVLVVLSRALEDVEDVLIDYLVVTFCGWEPHGDQIGRWLLVKIVFTLLLSLGLTYLIALRSNWYVAVTAISSVGYGNQAFVTPGDRTYAACWLFFGAFIYGRLLSLLSDYFGSPSED